MVAGQLRRGLHLVHRWLGIGLGLMVLLWYVSGLVMLYVARPQLTEAEHLEHLPPLDPVQALVSPHRAWQSLGLPGAPQAIRLNAATGRPAYRFLAGNHWYTVCADIPEAMPPLDQQQGWQLAAPLLQQARAVDLTAVETDQWTLARRFDPYRPFWHLTLDDGRHYYLSSRSAELVLDNTRSERAWNWVGSVLHWLYFTPLRQMGTIWRSLVLWTSFITLLLAVSGLWLGWQRLRIQHRYTEQRISPYREFWKYWHHLLGLSAGLGLLTWLLSGWLSLAPWGLATNPAPPAAETPRLLATANLPRPPDSRLSDTRELAWVRVGTTTALLESTSTQQWITLPGQARQSHLGIAQIRQAFAQAFVAPVHHADWLESADAHYFSLRHYPRTFPVVRLYLVDAAQSVVYVSPRTGAVELVYNKHDFAHRWLYQGLHRLDFPGLNTHPYWRDALLILLALPGIILAVSGCLLAWRRLLARRFRHRHRPMQAQPVPDTPDKPH